MQLTVWDISLTTSFRLRKMERFKCNIFKRELSYSAVQMILEQAYPDMQILPDELLENTHINLKRRSI